ncbi:hypothetical protein AYK24_07050 [Thermoplasmatales archaeon SG8-52-4]|nr:MAG: hypothetical protein AYK24_07050 [Thermoplasmatales archaeon SG8-52-4]
MKKIIAIIAILSIGLIALLSGCIREGEGTLILQITDAPGDLNITEALVTISEVRVHYAGINDNDTLGEWITIVNESQTFDLIELQNATELFGTANLSAGWYTQIRLFVEEALVTIDGIQHDLKISPQHVKLIKPWKIVDGETLVLTLDFDVQESIHENGSGKYIMNPTIKVIQE